MKKSMIALTALVIVGAAPAFLRAQVAASPASKVGVINIQAAIASTAEGKQAFADLQKKYQPRQQELQRLQQEIQAIQDQLSKQAATLSDDEQARLNRDAEEKQKLLKRSAEDAQNDFNRDRDETVNRLGQKMVRTIGEYAQQNGFTLVVDSAQIPIYFAAKDIDLTEAIVKRYDAANPAAGEGAAAKPVSHAATPASAPRPR